MIKTDVAMPRNKDIQENEDHEEKVIAKQQIEGAKRAKRIDELASIGEEKEVEVSKEEKDAKDLSDFIEIIIKVKKS